MGKLLEAFKILCTGVDRLKERGKLFKGGCSSREVNNQENTV